VFDASELADAGKRLHEFGQGLGRQVPEALACLEEDFNAATQFFTFPREHWTGIRSTNGLERLHGEVKRRTRSIGAFPDRIVTALAL
jgi:transposase-like protein